MFLAVLQLVVDHLPAPDLHQLAILIEVVGWVVKKVLLVVASLKVTEIDGKKSF